MKKLLGWLSLIFGCFMQLVMAQTLPVPMTYDGVHSVHIKTAWVEPLHQHKSATLVNLPDEWGKTKREGAWRYTVEFQIGPHNEIAASGINIPRIGNRFRLALDGVTLIEKGVAQKKLEDYSRFPQYVFLPTQLLVSGKHSITIDVYGDIGRYAGLSSFDLGPHNLLYSKFRLREVFQFWLLYAVLGFAVLFGALSVSLAIATKEKTFTFFALACLFTICRLLGYLVVEPPIDLDWWTALVETSAAGSIICFCLFGCWFVHLPKRSVYLLTKIMIAIASVCIPMYAFGHHLEFRRYITMSLLIYGVYVAMLVFWTCYRVRKLPNVLMAMAALMSILFGLYDHLLIFYSADGYAGFTLSRFSLFFFLFAMAYIIVYQFAHKVQQERRLRKQLKRELDEKSNQLEDQFKARQLLIEEQVKNKERQRLIQDIHDGMGLHLSGILGLIEEDETTVLDKKKLILEVRTAIDHMRLLVNNSVTFEGDWFALFGTLRHDLETRLRRFHIDLLWSMQTEPMISAPVSSLHAVSFQRLFFELTTNVIKHAHAGTVSVTITYDEQFFYMRFSDDGVGFLGQSTKSGLGLNSIQHRLNELQASMVMEDANKVGNVGVTYGLKIPYLRYPA